MKLRSMKAIFGALLAGALLMVGCASTEPSTPQQVTPKQTDDRALKVAVQYNALSIPTVFAHDQGYFEDEGLDVQISTFNNGAEENKALEKGDVDIASDGLASVYMLATGECSWIGESDSGSATLAVYAKGGSAPTQVSGQLEESPEILGSADTLRGLKVVGPAGTMEEWSAISYFSQFGLTPGEDFEFIEMDRADAAASVLGGTADIFVASDVDYCRLMEENGFVALAKGADVTRVPFNNGYLVSNRVVDDRYDDLVAFVRAVYRAAETLDGDRDLWNQYAYQYYKAHGKPATMEDVQLETEVRAFLVPSDFTAPDYRLGSGVLDVGRFNAEIGALEESQVRAIQDAINTKVLEDAFGITVQAATL